MKKELPDPHKLIFQKEFPGKEKADKEFREEDQDYLLAASYTDCTGLIPSAPKTEDEIDSYEQIQHFLPPSYIDREKDKEQPTKRLLQN